MSTSKESIVARRMQTIALNKERAEHLHALGQLGISERVARDRALNRDYKRIIEALRYLDTNE